MSAQSSHEPSIEELFNSLPAIPGTSLLKVVDLTMFTKLMSLQRLQGQLDGLHSASNMAKETISEVFKEL